MELLMRITLKRSLLAVLACALLVQSAQAQVQEYELKAALLVKLLAFVNWPADDAPESERNAAEKIGPCIGILGENPFGNTLANLLASSKDGVVAEVRQLASIEAAAQCQVLFVAGSESARLPDIRKVLEGKPVLTVSDAEGFAQEGGMISMVLRDSHISLEINTRAVRDAMLNISSKLLSLAKVVDDGEDPGDEAES